MTDSNGSSARNRFIAPAGTALAALVVGAIIGYLKGSSGEDGSDARALNWAIRNGFLYLGMMVFIIVLSATVMPRLNLAPRVVWASVIGIGLAIMSGGGILLGMSDEDFFAETIGAFLFGALIGAAAGPKMPSIGPTQDDKES